MPARVEDFRGRLTSGGVASAAAGAATPSPFDPHVPAGRFRVSPAARFARLDWRRPPPLTLSGGPPANPAALAPAGPAAVAPRAGGAGGRRAGEVRGREQEAQGESRPPAHSPPPPPPPPDSMNPLIADPMESGGFAFCRCPACVGRGAHAQWRAGVPRVPPTLARAPAGGGGQRHLAAEPPHGAGAGEPAAQGAAGQGAPAPREREGHDAGPNSLKSNFSIASRVRIFSWSCSRSGWARSSGSTRPPRAGVALCGLIGSTRCAG